MSRAGLIWSEHPGVCTDREDFAENHAPAPWKRGGATAHGACPRAGHVDARAQREHLQRTDAFPDELPRAVRSGSAEEAQAEAGRGLRLNAPREDGLLIILQGRKDTIQWGGAVQCRAGLQHSDPNTRGVRGKLGGLKKFQGECAGWYFRVSALLWVFRNTPFTR